MSFMRKLEKLFSFSASSSSSSDDEHDMNLPVPRPYPFGIINVTDSPKLMLMSLVQERRIQYTSERYITIENDKNGYYDHFPGAWACLFEYASGMCQFIIAQDQEELEKQIKIKKIEEVLTNEKRRRAARGRGEPLRGNAIAFITPSTFNPIFSSSSPLSEVMVVHITIPTIPLLPKSLPEMMSFSNTESFRLTAEEEKQSAVKNLDYEFSEMVTALYHSWDEPSLPLVTNVMRNSALHTFFNSQAKTINAPSVVVSLIGEYSSPLEAIGAEAFQKPTFAPHRPK